MCRNAIGAGCSLSDKIPLLPRAILHVDFMVFNQTSIADEDNVR
jgi:hypothetical protein